MHLHMFMVRKYVLVLLFKYKNKKGTLFICQIMEYL